MKKSLLAVSLLTALSTSAIAQDDYESWAGGFAELNSLDNDKTINGNPYDISSSIGIEYGFKFKPEWAARFELSKTNLENDVDGSQSADRYGADIMRFFNNNAYYVFGGLKFIDMTDSDLSVGYGIGKHINVAERIKVIIEVAGYHDIRENYNDTSAKLGLAYTFGNTSSASASTDADQDGVNDNVDQCLNSAIGASVDATGCNIGADSDNDGINDADDKCPNTPAGARVDSMGCSSDKDQDGILDADDKCADTPDTDLVDAMGCTVFKEIEMRETLKVSFANNSTVIENPNDPKIQEFADFMKRFPNTHTAIEGHASEPGEADYNMGISLKRARAVRQLLIDKYEIDADRLSAEGFGETQLIDTRTNKAANITNRRIEAVITVVNKEKVLKTK